MTATPAMATIVFTDLVGSTALRVSLGEERADELRRIHDRLLTERVVANGGRVVKGGGDGLLTAFESASAALTACVEMQQAIETYNRQADHLAELSVRIGLSAGDVLWEEQDCFGTPVIEAARLESAAEGGQILCSDLVRLMARGRGGHDLRPLGEFALKGLPEPVSVYEVRWVRPSVTARVPFPAGLLASSAGAFVGRTWEREEAQRMLAETSRSAPSVLWLTGEPGIGKTRLASEIAATMHGGGWTVLFGRCDETLQVPYQPVAEALRQVSACTDDAHLSGVFAGDVAAELAQLCPDLARRVPAPGGGTLRVELDQYRLFEAVRSWLSGLAVEAPVLFVVDDAHWATAPTMLLLNYLARNLDSGRVALLGTLRDTECSPETRSIIDEATLRPGGLALVLRGLDPAEVAELAESSGEGLASSGQLHEQTAGNPLFVRALLASGDASGTLGAAIRRRVTRLGARTQETLGLAALAGLDFDIGVLGAAAGADPIDLLERLEEAAHAGLLEEAGPNRYRFAHGLVRDALNRQVTVARRALGNRALAEAYERLQPANVVALARHWADAATDATSTARAVAALQLAGDAAEAVSDHDSATRAYRRALELVGGTDPTARTKLELGLGLALIDSGNFSAATEQLLLDAAASAEQLGLHEMRVESTARAVLVGGILGRASPAAVTLVTRLAQDPPSDPRLAARAKAIAANMWEWSDQPQRAVDAGLAALPAAEAMGDDWAIGWAHNAVATALPYERAHDKVRHSMASFTGLAAVQLDPLAIYWRCHLASSLLVVGDLDGLTHQLAQGEAEATRRREPFLQHVFAMADCCLALLRGEFEAAAGHAARAERLAELIEGGDLSGIHGLQQFSLRREQGRLSEIAPAMRLVARLDRSGGWRPGLAAIYADLGMIEEAAGELERVVPGGDIIDVPDDPRRPLSLSYLAEAACAIGDAGRAGLLYQEMAPWSGLTIASFLLACYGPADRFLGVLALTLGAEESARGHLHAALAQCRTIKSPTYEAHTRYWLARLAAKQGDARLATGEAEAGLMIARRIGMASLVERFERLLEGGFVG